MLNKIMHLMLTVVIFLITIIFLKSNLSFKNWFNKNVLNNHISFTNIASKYETLFGRPLPFRFLKEKEVFNEKLNYFEKEKYGDGVILKTKNSLIPSLGDGLVIFIGTRDEQKCLTIEENTHDVIYCGFTNVGVSLYDHVEYGSYIGEVQDYLILYFIKNGEYLNYEDFI